MEEAEEQEAERRREEERAEAEQKAAEVRKVTAGKKRKAAGSVEEDGSEAPEGFAKGEPCYLCRKAEVVCYWPDGYVFLLMSSV